MKLCFPQGNGHLRVVIFSIVCLLDHKWNPLLRAAVTKWFQVDTSGFLFFFPPLFYISERGKLMTVHNNNNNKEIILGVFQVKRAVAVRCNATWSSERNPRSWSPHWVSSLEGKQPHKPRPPLAWQMFFYLWLQGKLGIRFFICRRGGGGGGGPRHLRPAGDGLGTWKGNRRTHWTLASFLT